MKTQTVVLTVIVSIAVFSCPACAGSQAGNSAAADSTLRQVALFKNGLGFFISEVTCPATDDTFSFVPAAAAAHGTFWIAYPPQVKLHSLIAKEVESEQPVEVITIYELLKANVGRKVRLTLSGRQMDCLIKYLPEDRQAPVPQPYAPGSPETAIDRRGPDSMRSRLMIIETASGEMSVDPYNVQDVEFPAGKAEKTFTSKSKSMQLEVKMDSPAGGKKLTITYLAKGITWAPSYMVDITDGDKARLSAKAEVINEACDLNDITVQLVTGFPHLQFADVISPLALKGNLAAFLQSLTSGATRPAGPGVLSPVMAQSAAAYEARFRSEAERVMPEYGAAQAGQAAEDLFLYPVEHITLKKGQVAYLPLFTESVPYKHIYQWNIPDYVNEEDYYRYPARRQEEQKPDVEVVWHCLRLENTARVPWTTAPAETVGQGLILGQDTLDYTPPKGQATLRITRAVNVKAEQIELEIDRKRDAAQLYGNHYDLVTVEGKLSVTNFQQKSAALEITKTLSGEVKSSQPQPAMESLARGLQKMNGVKKLTWTIDLEPGEQKQLGYTYEVYVRR
jgi:hypothetical protein